MTTVAGVDGCKAGWFVVLIDLRKMIRGRSFLGLLITPPPRPSPVKGGGRARQKKESFTLKLKAIVNDYIIRCRKRATEELRWFREEKDFSKVVSRAAKALKPDGKKFRHQWRIADNVLSEAEVILTSKIQELKNADSFDDLHTEIGKLVGGIKGIGELYIYDTSLRIGASLGLEPDKVYLHAGTRKGAENLGLNDKRKYLSVDELPKEFQRLKPREIEDCLCIYKNEFLGGVGKIYPPNACSSINPCN